MLKQFMLLRKNRYRKKVALYRHLIAISFDVTVALYTVCFAGYLIFVFVHSGGIDLSSFTTFFNVLSEINISFTLICTVLPIIFMIRSFRHPGIIVTTSDHMLLYLPHTETELLRLAMVERVIKMFIVLCVMSIFIFIVIPSIFTRLFSLLVAYFIVTTLMIPIEWKLYHESFVIKFGAIFIAFCFQTLHFFMSEHALATFSFASLIVICAYTFNRLTDNIDWQKVTASSDYHVWHMPLISYATKIKWQRERSYPIWQRMNWWMRPFRYDIHHLYKRLTLIHIGKEIKAIVQLIGVSFLLLFVTAIIHPYLFFIALIIVGIIYQKLIIALLKSFLTTDSIAHLPKDIRACTALFHRWLFILFVPQTLPLIIFLSHHYTSVVFVTVSLLIALSLLIFAYLSLKRNGEKLIKQLHI